MAELDERAGVGAWCEEGQSLLRLAQAGACSERKLLTAEASRLHTPVGPVRGQRLLQERDESYYAVDLAG